MAGRHTATVDITGPTNDMSALGPLAGITVTGPIATSFLALQGVQSTFTLTSPIAVLKVSGPGSTLIINPIPAAVITLVLCDLIETEMCDMTEGQMCLMLEGGPPPSTLTYLTMTEAEYLAFSEAEYLALVE